jgi:hypothetical protein
MDGGLWMVDYGWWIMEGGRRIEEFSMKSSSQGLAYRSQEFKIFNMNHVIDFSILFSNT